MPATPTNIPTPFIFPATSRTPRPRPRSPISPSQPYTPTPFAKAFFFQPPIKPLPPITADDRTAPPQDVYEGRGLVDLYYVFSKPPRAQRPCRPSEKVVLPKHEVKQHYPLRTSPGAKVKRASTSSFRRA